MKSGNGARQVGCVLHFSGLLDDEKCELKVIQKTGPVNAATIYDLVLKAELLLRVLTRMVICQQVLPLCSRLS